MLTGATYTKTAEVNHQLERVKNKLPAVENFENVGFLRSAGGFTDRTFLKGLAPRGLTDQFYSNPAFANVLSWFTNESLRELGERFSVLGYIGLIKPGGLFVRMHDHSELTRRLVISFNSGAVNSSTMRYEGETPFEAIEGRAITDVLAVEGSEVFKQTNVGQIGVLESDTQHAEPPLPANTPRLFLASTLT